MDRDANTIHSVRRVLILADESADWEVAGLRQLDRVALVLHELAADQRHRMAVSVFWDTAFAAERWLPGGPRLAGMSVADFEAHGQEPFDLVVSTRLFLYRGSIPPLTAALEQTRGDELVSGHARQRVAFLDVINHR